MLQCVLFPFKKVIKKNYVLDMAEITLYPKNTQGNTPKIIKTQNHIGSIAHRHSQPTTSIIRPATTRFSLAFPPIVVVAIPPKKQLTQTQKSLMIN